MGEYFSVSVSYSMGRPRVSEADPLGKAKRGRPPNKPKEQPVVKTGFDGSSQPPWRKTVILMSCFFCFYRFISLILFRYQFSSNRSPLSTPQAEKLKSRRRNSLSAAKRVFKFKIDLFLSSGVKRLTDCVLPFLFVLQIRLFYICVVGY